MTSFLANHAAMFLGPWACGSECCSSNSNAPDISQKGLIGIQSHHSREKMSKKKTLKNCKPYDANSHFSSSCLAVIMHPSDPISRRGDASIRSLQIEQISPSYSLRFGLQVIANGAMSGPWPQTDRRTLVK